MTDDPATIFFTGTAGAGKSTLVSAYRTWLSTQGFAATVVNLDPGSESAELDPDVDIREWVRLPNVMDEFDLGPNGAQVAAADMIALKVFEVKQALTELRSDFVLVDTPGQIELFAFRESSKAIVEALGGERSALAFLFDPALAKAASGFVALAMLSATVEFRFRLPTVNLLTKTDLLEAARLEEILGWSEDPERLVDAVDAELQTPDVQLSGGILRALESMAPLMTLLPTSSKTSAGLEPMYRRFQLQFHGGSDVEPSHAPPEEG
ncbi:MAG TPA: ATP/GTP-binding protein [Thermoplasmata archaeon]|nr:ATP/GTP-binding protein [Thermoplasmata archaeon]